MQIQEHDDREDNATFFLMLDVVPAIVIMLSAVVAGVSADNDPNNTGWKVLEILFTVFFIGEVIVKLRVFGWKEYLWGPEWYWSWFDILCIILAVVYMGITYTADQEAREIGPNRPLVEIQDFHGAEVDDPRGLHWASCAFLGHCPFGDLHVLDGCSGSDRFL